MAPSLINMTWCDIFVSAVRRGDVLAAWSGIRPLVTDPSSKDTQSICRNHIVSISDSGLVTIAGELAFICLIIFNERYL